MATINKIPKCPPLRFPDFNDDWKETTLGEVAEITSGYSGEQEQTETPYRVSRIETISSGVIDIDRVGFVPYDARLEEYKLSLGDILFSNINSIEHIGKSAIVRKPVDLYHGMNLLRLKAINIDPYALYYHLQRDVVRNRFRSIANKAVSQASINQTTLGKEVILFASSLSEQKKIADFLSLIDERIQSCSETLKERKREKAGLLNQLFSQKLRFPDYSNEWTTSTISKVCKVSTGSMNTQDKVDGGDYPFYVRSSTIERSNRYTYDGIAILTPGDGAIGKIFHYSEGKIAVHQRVYILSEITIDAKYLFYYFSDKFYNRVIRMSAKNTVDSVRINMITDMPLSLPSLAEQKKIADFLSLIDERIEVEEQLLQQYEKQKRYLLKQMFV